jgi:hypothetical protein
MIAWLRKPASPQSALGRELAIVIVAKILLLLLLYWLFFSPAHRPATDVAAHLVDDATTMPSRR